MFSSHLSRIWNNRVSKTLLIILLVFPSVEILQNLYWISLGGEMPNPIFAFFLTGQSMGHATQSIYLWFLPIYFLIFVSDDTIQDYNTGYKNILISKVGKKCYYKEKLVTSFCLPFFIMLLSLVINLILVSVLFRNGIYYRSQGIEMPNNLLFTISMKYPLFADLAFAFIASIVAGFSGILGSSFAFLFHDKKYTYPVTFLLWLILILRKKSLMLIFQPFTEYDFNVLIPIFLLITILSLTISIVIYIYEVNYVEL